VGSFYLKNTTHSPKSNAQEIIIYKYLYPTSDIPFRKSGFAGFITGTSDYRKILPGTQFKISNDINKLARVLAKILPGT
jgi:hypothetical protein